MPGNFGDLPQFQPPFTGIETFPFDTRRGEGSPPQSATVDPSGLAVAGAGGSTDLTADSAVNVNCTVGCVFALTLTQDVTLALSDPSPGQCIVLELTQDGTGSRTVTWPASVTWPAGTAPTLTTTPAAVDVVTLRYNEVADAWRGGSALAFA